MDRPTGEEVSKLGPASRALARTWDFRPGGPFLHTSPVFTPSKSFFTTEGESQVARDSVVWPVKRLAEKFSRSFGFAPVAKGAPLTGDIYIAPAVARKNAVEHGAGIREELLRLVVHGMLHVIGYDHPVDDARYGSPMWKRQERLLRGALVSA